MEQFKTECPNCGGGMVLKGFGCPGCGLELHGEIELPRLLRLSPEDREFIELFVLAGGSLKELGTQLGISYPTIRARLDNVIAKIRELDNVQRKERLEILSKLEKGEISAKDAVRFLRKENTASDKNEKIIKK